MKRIVRNVEETEALAGEVVKSMLEKGLGQKATIVGLYGDLGAGKTTFTKAVANILGIKETVASPTFVIEKIYTLSDHKLPTAFQHFIHIDAYRLESGNELLNLGFKEILANPANAIFLEWPERVAEILPEDMIKIRFTHVDESTREIEVMGVSL